MVPTHKWLKRKIRLILSLCVVSLVYFLSSSLGYQLTFKNGFLVNDQQKNNNTSLAQVPKEGQSVIFENNQQGKLNETTDKLSSSDKNAANEINEIYSKANRTLTSNAIVNLIDIDLKKTKTLKIGILIPSTTQKITKPDLKTLSLTTLCLPSLLKTFNTEYLYQIYIGIDKGDYLESVKNEITRLFSNVIVVIVSSSKKSFTRSVNAIARKAYEDGVDYFVRVNDDTTFETKNWTSSALDILLSYKPPNVGVVGPTCEEGNTGILTHDMVHRTHLVVFGFYYPIYFDNWWADDWITKVYEPERSTKIDSWIVKHHNRFHKTRYKVKKKQFRQLSKIVSYDQGRVAEYLKVTLNSTNLHI